jgi:outer membrane lipoprotein LolB
MKAWNLLFLGSTLCLSACVSLTLPKTPKTHFQHISPVKRQKQAEKLHAFQVSGAFSIVQANKKPVLANYTWKQRNKGFYRIRVASSLNLFTATIAGRPGSVTLWKSKNQHVVAPTPEALLEQEMGWKLPVRHLFYWIRGVAAPGKKRWKLDAYGHITSLVQQGWQIQYSNYTKINGIDLPRKTVLKRQGIRITIVMKRWILTNKP